MSFGSRTPARFRNTKCRCRAERASDFFPDVESGFASGQLSANLVAGLDGGPPWWIIDEFLGLIRPSMCISKSRASR
jgi:hypothetical protein